MVAGRPGRLFLSVHFPCHTARPRNTGLQKAVIYVFTSNKGERLDGMAGFLMDGKVSGGRETFLELFISLAAMENQIPAFIIGKMQLADLYFRQNRREECRSIILDLTKMRVENDELSSLRQELEAQ